MSVDKHIVSSTIKCVQLTLINDWRSVFNVKEKIDNDEIKKIKDRIEKTTRLPMFVLGVMSEMEILTDNIIDYFSCEEEENAN